MRALTCSILLISCTAAGFAAGQDRRSAGDLAQRIDRELAKNQAAAQVTPAAPAEDTEFLRRIYLDLHGVVPPLERVVAFLGSKDPNRRIRLVDELLASPAYGGHFALAWYNRMVPRAARNLGVANESLQDWLAEQLNRNHGWDRIVAEMLLSEGERSKNPGTSFYFAALGNVKPPQPEPERIAASVSRLFLGVRLECCQCHDHPFTKFKQTEFWGLAAFFTNVRADHVSANPKASPILTEGVTVGTYVIRPKGPTGPAPISKVAAIEIPESKGKVAPARFLGGPDFDSEGTTRFRPALVQWMVSPANPWFARAAVNRTWAHFFGRGIVEPVDDMRPENRPSHPELLDLLTEELVASGYDLKHLVRSIVGTQAYQRTSTAPAGQRTDLALYVHMPPRVMTADQLYDSLTRILEHPVGEHIANAGQRRKYGDARERFRAFFHNGADDDNIPVTEYGHGIPQVLRIMNEPALTDGTKMLQKIAKRRGEEKIIETLWLTTLARFPSAEETQRMAKFLAEEPDRGRGFSDLLWVLLNSGEFLHNH